MYFVVFNADLLLIRRKNKITKNIFSVLLSSE